MVDVLFGILVFVAITAVAVVVFGGWIMVGAGRWVVRSVGGSPGRARGTEGMVVCPQAGCRISNPAGARFCRRCGSAMGRI